jgi:hypothetical protein
MLSDEFFYFTFIGAPYNAPAGHAPQEKTAGLIPSQKESVPLGSHIPSF